ncbi:hypothetical protein [Frateuria aurantia]
MLWLPLGFGLAGCTTTVHNRWAMEGDTLRHWQLQMHTMPVEIHGGFAAQDATAIAAEVARGTTPEVYAAQRPAPDTPLQKTPRVLIYLGTGYLPSDETYCQPKPKLRTVGSQVGKVNIFAAICDGSRLVVRTEQQQPSDQWVYSQVGAIVEKAEERLLYAVSTSPGTPSMGQ